MVNQTKPRNLITTKLNQETLSQPEFTTAIEQVVVYPNPSKKVVYLKTAESFDLSKVIITDVSGKQCLVKTENLTEINIEQLSNGLYFIQAFSEKGVFTVKFVKE